MKRQNFQPVSDHELIRNLKKLIRTERSITLQVVYMLIEVERRRLFLKMGYSSMHDYVSRGLGYSDSAAFRRIKTARSVALYPEIEGMIRRGDLSFCAVAKISNALTPENKNELLRRVCGKRLREIDAILAEDKPAIMVRDKIKPIGRAEPEESPAESCNLFDREEKRSVFDRRNGGQEVATPRKLQRPVHREDEDGGGERHAEEREVKSPLERRYKIEFSASEEFIRELAQVQALVSNGPAGASYEALFRKLMVEYLDRHDPAKKQERREKRRERAEKREEKRGAIIGVAEQTSEDENPAIDLPEKDRDTSIAFSNSPGVPGSRHIPVALRDEISVRDGNQCTFVGRDGTRCKATRYLQIDHIKPFALGGGHNVGNLRLLCGAHNRLEAEEIFGVAYQVDRSDQHRPPGCNRVQV